MTDMGEKFFQKVLSAMLFEAEKAIVNCQHVPVIIAIDGNCGSGKTTYGDRLATFFSAPVIHCDDFFLPKPLRTAERLNEVGGNIHYERLRALLNRLRCDQTPVTSRQRKIPTFTYRAYNCSTDTYEQRSFVASKVVIVEGSYALHPMLAEFYDLKILLTVDEQTQRCRLLAREGEQGLANFVNKWIPLENRYFASLDKSDCIVIDTSKI